MFEILFSFASTCIYSSCFLGMVSLASLSPGFLVPEIAAMDVDYVSMSPIQFYSSPWACAAKCLFSYAKFGKFYSYSFDLLVSSRLLLLQNCKKTIVRVNNRYCKVSLFETSKTTQGVVFVFSFQTLPIDSKLWIKRMEKNLIQAWYLSEFMRKLLHAFSLNCSVDTEFCFQVTHFATITTNSSKHTWNVSWISIIISAVVLPKEHKNMPQISELW